MKGNWKNGFCWIFPIFKLYIDWIYFGSSFEIYSNLAELFKVSKEFAHFWGKEDLIGYAIIFIFHTLSYKKIVPVKYGIHCHRAVLRSRERVNFYCHLHGVNPLRLGGL